MRIPTTLFAVAPLSLCLLAVGCLPSRRGAAQQTAAPQNYPSGYGNPQWQQGQAQPQQNTWQQPQQNTWQQPQPQPTAAQPAAAQPGVLFPSVLGLPAIGLPWATTGTANTGDAGQGQAASPLPFPFPFPMPWGNGAGTATGGNTTPAGGGTTAVDPNHPADWARMEQEVLAEVNVRRAQGANCGGKVFGPAAPMVMNASLQAAARLHSRDMGSKNYFSHDSLDGRKMGDRVKAQGFKGTTYGENIAAGRGTAREAVEQWMNSPGHCENIMYPRYTMLGVGYAYVSSSTYGHYWTQNFGG